MKIIIDSNVLFSALLRDSDTRRIILEYDGFFLFPSFIFEEMREHLNDLLKRSGMNKDEFDLLLKIITGKNNSSPC